PGVPKGVFAISESGMRDARDVERLTRVGARGVLVGESLMRSQNPERDIAAMKRACKHA
ncbi:MAG: indole-3-glycerol-phosphate synthase TrpC, partial [Vulcanimicrobiaceae bacterium]